jgi:hypothetical protein
MKACCGSYRPLEDYGGNPLEPIDIETKVSLVYDEFVSPMPRMMTILVTIIIFIQVSSACGWCRLWSVPGNGRQGPSSGLLAHTRPFWRGAMPWSLLRLYECSKPCE